MNANLTGWAAVCLGVLVFKLVYEGAKPLHTKWRILGFVVLLGIGMPALLSAMYYLHFLPEKEWFYELRSWRGSEFFAIPLAASAACLATLFPRRLVTVFLLATVAVSSVPYIKPLLVPLSDSMIHDQWTGDACMQSTPSTCGPASIATILRSLGLPASERTIARQAHTYAGGTEAWYLARYVRSQGLNARFDFRSGLPENMELPAMIGVKLGGFGHFIPILERDGDMLTLADPLHGKETISLKDLQKRCQLTGFHLIISRK